MKQLFFLFFFITSLSYSQENIQTKSDTHIFWQKENKLSISDFRKDVKSISDEKKYCEEIGLCTVASVGVFAIIDIPKKKKNRKKLHEKVFIAPAFEFATSYIVNKDTIGVEKQQLVFDIYELSARKMRKELHNLSLDMNQVIGVYSMFLKTIEASAAKERRQTIDQFTKDIYIDQTEGAFEKWRQLIDEELLKYEEYATTERECLRFVKNHPIDDGYIMADTVVGNLF